MSPRSRRGGPSGVSGSRGSPRRPAERSSGHGSPAPVPPRSSSARTGGRTQPAAGRGLGGEQVEGRQAVRELLRAGRRAVRRVLVATGQDESSVLDEIESLAARRRVRVEHVPARRLADLARTEVPQGVLAQAAAVPEVALEDLCRPSDGSVPFLVVLDGVTDPHNLGAVLRTAECAGVTGVLLPRHRAVHLTPAVTKAAAGAVEHVPLALVPGVPGALRQLAGLGVWTVGLDARAARTVYQSALGEEPVALVVGGEGDGLSPLARKRCDELVAVPLHGSLRALNLSAAAAVACFEVAHRRSQVGRSGGSAPGGSTARPRRAEDVQGEVR
ncbi:MAG TPA: 23S rRNA (guanosine(2251)-2'-O)-methyltransferase RlmB [Acidimicrobiales bacterium]|nr:23S rRNA (guanosine(2251)-2'-O)-methyltransferase RlmB [Acidimicrobiales bacterium]